MTITFLSMTAGWAFIMAWLWRGRCGALAYFTSAALWFGVALYGATRLGWM